MTTKFLRVQGFFYTYLAGKIQPLQKYNMVDLKHCIEQATRDLLICDYQYKEVFTHLNLHLLLGYFSAIAAISSAVYGYTHPFEEFQTKLILVVGCTLYYIGTGILALYNRYIKKDEIFVGDNTTDLEPTHIVVSLKIDKLSHKLEMVFAITKTKVTKTYKLEESVGSWFTTMGEFVPTAFQESVQDTISGNSKKNK